MIRKMSYLVLAGLAAVALVATAQLTQAKMRVIQSDVPEIAVGSEWDDNAKLPIPPGRSVRVLVLPSNVTKEIKGPAATGKRSAPWGGTRGPTQ